MVAGTNYYLAVGDTSTAGALDLMDGLNYLLVENGWHFTPAKDPDPLAPVLKGKADHYATIVLDIDVMGGTGGTGGTGDTLAANYRAIETKLLQARLAEGPYPLGTGVCLWQRELGQTQYVYWDVCDGELAITASAAVGNVKRVALTLYVLPFPHGAAVTYAVTGMLTNGLAAVLYQAGIPGDVPGPARLTLVDLSTSGVVIQGFRAGGRSLPSGGLGASDWTPILDLTPTSPGATFTDAGAIGGSTSRLAMNGVMRTIAQVSRPSGAAQNGLMDLWAPVRDASVVLGTPGLPTVTPSVSGGSLTDGAYQYLLTAYDGSGNESPVSPSAFGIVPVQAVSVLDTAETASTAAWSGPVISGAVFQGQGNVTVQTAAAYPQSAGSLYGFRANAANGMGAWLWQPTPGAGNVAVVRHHMRINTDTGASSTTVYTQIPLVFDNTANHLSVVSLFNIGAGWRVGTAIGVLDASVLAIPEGDWVTLEAVCTWNGSTSYVVAIYVNDLLIRTTTALGSVIAPTNSGFGAITFGPGTALQVDFDDVQLNATHIGAPAGSNGLTWAAAANASGYYLRWNRNGSGWRRIDVGNVTSYTHALLTAGTFSDPPSGMPAAVPSSLKAQVAMKTATATPTFFDGPVVQPTLTGGVWVPVYFGTLPFPPGGPQDGTDPVAWTLQFQGQTTGTGTPNVDVDAAILIPHRELPQVSVAVPTLDLAAARAFVLDTNRYGFATCQLQQLPYLLDGFNRATALSTLGTADTGQSYIQVQGTFGIANNHFYVNTVTTANKCFAYADAGHADAVVQATLVTVGADLSYIIFRGASAASWYAVQMGAATPLTLVQCLAGTITTVATNARTAVAGDVITVTFSGSVASVAINGVTLISGASIPSFPSATYCGLGSNNAATEAWDGFSVQAAAGVVEGELVPVGALFVGPGDTELVVLPLVAGGKYDAQNCKFSLQLRVVPRFRYVRGNA